MDPNATETAVRKNGESSELIVTQEVEHVEAESLGPRETVRLPVFALQAALLCLGKGDDKRDYMNGVHLVAFGETEIRVEATDGNRAFIYAMAVPAEESIPGWLDEQGIMLPQAGLKERLLVLEKLESDVAVIAYQTNAPQLTMSDPREHAVFRMEPVEASFPNLQQLVDKLNLAARSQGDLASVAYNPSYLKGVADIAKRLEAEQVRVFGTANPEDGAPSLITFPGCPGAVLILMPMTPPTEIEAGTMRVLSGAVTGTIAALRAHRTRLVMQLDKAQGERQKKAIETRIASYDTRIAAIIAQTTPALPAPAQEPEAAEEGEEATAAAPAEPLTTPESADATISARQRRKLKGAAADKARAKFAADTNAALSARGRVTLSQLADGVPVDAWFDAGLSPEEAAERCLSWEKKSA